MQVLYMDKDCHSIKTVYSLNIKYKKNQPMDLGFRLAGTSIIHR